MKRIKTKKASELFEGEIKPFSNTKPFYIVVVQGGRFIHLKNSMKPSDMMHLTNA